MHCALLPPPHHDPIHSNSFRINMSAQLPTFRFHPDPIASGSVVISEKACSVCEKVRGYIYTGPTYCEEEIEEAICPWCLADGSAHTALDAVFHDVTFADATTADEMAEIEERTPGFATFNPIQWPSCCDLPMAYIEPAGVSEIRARYYTLEGLLMTTIVHEMGISGGAAHAFLNALRRDTSPCVHVFHCLTCDTVLGRIDRI